MKQRIDWVVQSHGARVAFTLPEPCSSFTVGGPGCDMPVPGVKNVCVQCNVGRETIDIFCDEATLRGPEGECHSLSLTEGATVSVAKGDVLNEFEIIITLSELRPAQFDRVITLNEGETTFGNQLDAHVQFDVVGASGAAFQLRRGNDGAMLLNVGRVPLGVYINHTRCRAGETYVLADGAFIFLAGMTFAYLGGNILTDSDKCTTSLSYRDNSEQNSHLLYPHMSRTTRYHHVVPTGELEVLDPPSLNEPKAQNLLLTLLPAVLSIVLIVFVRGAFTSSGGGMILFSALTMAVGALTTVLTFIKGRKDAYVKKIERNAHYRHYIDVRTDEIREVRENEKHILRRIYIEPRQELQAIQDFSADLFDRTPADQDFLDLRLGYGRLPSGQKIKYRRHEVLDTVDELSAEPARLANEFACTDGLPAVIRAREASAIGFLGNMPCLRDMMNQVTLDLCTRQFADDCELYYLCGDDFGQQVASYRMFPHVWNKRLDCRNIACDPESQNLMLETLYQRLSDREEKGSDVASQPWLVIFVHASDDVMQHPLMKYIDKAAQLHAVFLFWAKHREQLPQGCRYMVRLFTNVRSGLLVDMFSRNEDLLFDYEAIPNSIMAAAAQRLSPVYCSEVSLASTLTSSLSFYELFKMNEARSEDVLAAWEQANPRKSLAVPLGVVSSGEVITLDLHEKVHGPHGLVAGTTGSGKSESLVSYLLALAYHFSPEDVVFVIIDFKGGGMANQLAGLPHMIGSITNLDGHEMQRSLASIRAEQMKRQRMLKDAGVNNISNYYREYKAGRVSEPLPHLFIVADEFAELKAQQPAFMDELISTARIGRSLGVHLILATQKPHGVVNEQIWSNSDFKLCLRVQTKDDSNEMLHSPLASEIREPGRAYLQVGRTGTFQLLQSGYSGAPADESLLKKEAAFQINSVALSGRRVPIYRYDPPRVGVGENERIRTQFDATKAAIIEAFGKTGMKLPSVLCLPSLPAVLPFRPSEGEEPFELNVGMYDNPSAQEQKPYAFDLLADNVLIAGSAQTGKTTLLQTLLRAAAERLTAEEINVYVLDFNSGVFRTMENLAIMGGVAQMDHEEKMKNLFKMLRTETMNRKEKLVDASVTSLRAYRNLGHRDMPAILLMIDNFVVFKELFDERYGADLLYLLREGPSVGITTTVTTTQTIALGFRRLCYFNTRVALYCSDKNEYGAVLESTRQTLPEIPGRFMVKIGKEVLTGQVYMPFEGLNEQERAAATQAFVQAHSDGPRANAIPEVPVHLTADILSRMFRLPAAPAMFAYGMDYGNVEPLCMNLNTQFELSLIGRNQAGRTAFINALLDHLKPMVSAGQAEIRILDHYDRPLAQHNGQDYVAQYSLDYTKDGPGFMLHALAVSRERQTLVKAEGSSAIADAPLMVYILNAKDAITAIAGNREAKDAFADMAMNGRRTKILFIFGEIENRAISYSASDILKHIKESKQALVFENLGVVKCFDVPASVVRANTIRLGPEDAYLFEEDVMRRVHLVQGTV